MTRTDFAAVDFRDPAWRWHHLAPEIIERLRRSAPEERRWVKSNPARAVARWDDLFLKFSLEPCWKARLFPGLRKEFRASRLLRSAGITAVEHLGWARRGSLTLLVTRAWHPDAVSVADFWQEHVVCGAEAPGDFPDRLAEYLAGLLRRSLRHPDFHLGNILWSPRAREFALVDLHGVGLGGGVGARTAVLEVLPKLREAVAPENIVRLLSAAAGTDRACAEALLHRLLRRERTALRRQWPRRRGQLLSGYPKFSEVIRFRGGNMLVRRDALQRPMFVPPRDREQCERVTATFAEGLEQLLFSFYLTLLKVPHPVVTALAEDGTFFRRRIAAPSGAAAPPDGLCQSCLADLGLRPAPGDWGCSEGGAPMVTRPEAVLADWPERHLLLPRGACPEIWPEPAALSRQSSYAGSSEQRGA